MSLSKKIKLPVIAGGFIFFISTLPSAWGEGSGEREFFRGGKQAKPLETEGFLRRSSAPTAGAKVELLQLCRLMERTLK